MKQPHRDHQVLGALDALIAEITVDAYGDDEKLWAFRQTFEDHIVVPCDVLVIGEPVSVIDLDYDRNARRGLTAVRQNRSRHRDLHRRASSMRS